jgi:hypothetical protein
MLKRNPEFDWNEIRGHMANDVKCMLPSYQGGFGYMPISRRRLGEFARLPVNPVDRIFAPLSLHD